MKFKKLVEKVENFSSKFEQGKQIQPEELQHLQQLLEKKKNRYEHKLSASSDPDKRKSLEIKLKVVNAQIEKSKKLISETFES